MAKCVTVIIPAYNVEKYISGAIASVTGQSYTELDIVVVNDGSTDSTGEKIRLQAEKDPRVRVINKENGGLSSARNRGIDEIRGEYVAFLDGDDTLTPAAIEELVAAADAHPGMIIAADRLIKEEGKEPVPRGGLPVNCEKLAPMEALMDIAKGRYYLQSVCHKLFPADIAGKLKFDEDIRQGEDRVYMHRAIGASAGVYYMNRPLWEVFVRSGSLSRSKLSMRWMDSVTALDRMIADSEGTLKKEYERYRMELIILFIGAYISRQSCDPAFFAAIRKLAVEGMGDYFRNEKRLKERLAAVFYTRCPEALLKVYIRLARRVL